MSFQANWRCPHCKTWENGLGEVTHLANCKKNPSNYIEVEIYFGDKTFFENQMVFAKTVQQALANAIVPKGGYAKPQQQ